MRGDSSAVTFDYLFVEPLHIVGVEGGLKGGHLVEDAAEGPHIRLVVVRLVLPHLGAGVVRRSRLGVEQTLLGDFGDIHVSQFNCSVLVQEYIGALHISMIDF